MKKLILKTAACLLLSFVSLSALADPKPPVPQSYGLTKEWNQNMDPRNFDGNKRDIMQSPLTPATLVLLTLASGFAGVKIYRNNKEK